MLLLQRINCGLDDCVDGEKRAARPLFASRGDPDSLLAYLISHPRRIQSGRKLRA